MAVRELRYGTNFRHAGIYKNQSISDSTNNGISSTRKELYIVWNDVTVEEVKAFCEKDNNYTLDDFICAEYRQVCGSRYVDFIPLKYKDTKVWTMFGGNYIDIDSITRDKLGLSDTRPLALHDRVESAELTKILSV